MKGLVDAWEDSRQERTWMRHGERVASIENEIEGSMRPRRFLDWLLDRDEPEPENENQHDEEEAER